MMAAWLGLLLGGIYLIISGLCESHLWKAVLGGILLAALALWSAKAMKGVGPDNMGV